MRPRLLLTINWKFAVEFFARGLHIRTAVARLPLRQLGFLVTFVPTKMLQLLWDFVPDDITEALTFLLIYSPLIKPFLKLNTIYRAEGHDRFSPLKRVRLFDIHNTTPCPEKNAPPLNKML